HPEREGRPSRHPRGAAATREAMPPPRRVGGADERGAGRAPGGGEGRGIPAALVQHDRDLHEGEERQRGDQQGPCDEARRLEQPRPPRSPGPRSSGRHGPAGDPVPLMERARVESLECHGPPYGMPGPWVTRTTPKSTGIVTTFPTALRPTRAGAKRQPAAMAIAA